jgi:hypothetical protein
MPIKATAREPISRPDTYQRVPLSRMFSIAKRGRSIPLGRFRPCRRLFRRGCSSLKRGNWLALRQLRGAPQAAYNLCASRAQAGSHE